MKDATMTSRERILATVAGEATDHVPLSMEVHPSYLLYDPKIAHWRDQFERTDDLLALGTDPMVEIWLPGPMLSSQRQGNQFAQGQPARRDGATVQDVRNT